MLDSNRQFIPSVQLEIISLYADDGASFLHGYACVVSQTVTQWDEWWQKVIHG